MALDKKFSFGAKSGRCPCVWQGFWTLESPFWPKPFHNFMKR